jgi:hypothetical protein
LSKDVPCLQSIARYTVVYCRKWKLTWDRPQ